MKTFSLTFALAILGVVIARDGVGAPVVVAGSHLVSSPPYFAESFWAATSNIDRAFPFEVVDGGPWKLSALHVPVYRYPNSVVGATNAQFSLHADQSGLPGASIATFAINNIPLDAQILSLAPLEQSPLVLYPDTRYWVLASASRGQLNWNHANFKVGMAAYHVDGEGWTIIPSANICAFAVLASAVPEPTGLVLGFAAAIGFGSLRRERRLMRGNTCA
jgi:hypothetical protein